MFVSIFRNLPHSIWRLQVYPRRSYPSTKLHDFIIPENINRYRCHLQNRRCLSSGMSKCTREVKQGYYLQRINWTSFDTSSEWGWGTAPRYVGPLRMWWISSSGHPTRNIWITSIEKCTWNTKSIIRRSQGDGTCFAYSEGARFKSRSRYRLSQLMCSWFSSVPTGKLYIYI